MHRFLLLLLALACTLRAEPPKVSQWQGYERSDFTVGERTALLVKPKTPAEGRPWIWRTEFFGHEPQADVALLGAGWHVAYIKVSDMYGAPPAIEAMSKFHAHLVKEYALSNRAILEGFSRGGLYAVNYAAAHPDHTAAIYIDAPVLDINSWPGGKGKSKGRPPTLATSPHALRTHRGDRQNVSRQPDRPRCRTRESRHSGDLRVWCSRRRRPHG
jgi:pimeloyl-ACP methyl ester carboxylesterase